tara:strand:- start:384 stop:1127 length:744 start_codon:yes stop_codon:yes gene_type:complete
MRFYKVNGINHRVYEPDDEMPLDLLVLKDWRCAQVGEWVMADDGCVIQILRKGKMLKRMGKSKVKEYVGTCTGTFPVNNSVKMDTSRREDIYSFSGKRAQDRMKDKKNLSTYEEKFVALMSAGISPEDAYLQAYPTENRKYAFEKSGTLMKTERVKTAMKEELKPVLEELGINEEYVLKTIKEVIHSTDKDETRLKALFKLADIMDLEDKSSTKVTQVTGALFQGFSNKEIEGAIRPKEIEVKNGKG